MKIEEIDGKRILLPSDENKFIMINEPVQILEEGEKIIPSYFKKAFLPLNLTIEQCEKMYVELSQEEIDSL